MATITNFDAASMNRMTRMKTANGDVPARVRREANASADAIPSVQYTAKIRRSEEAQRSRESSASSTPEREPAKISRMSVEELAEVLRKVNLTFDTFEIQAKFIIDQSTGDTSVEVINQRTGEVIRKIPPYDVPKVAQAILDGEALLTDIKV